MAKKLLADKAQAQLSAKEFIAIIWAREVSRHLPLQSLERILQQGLAYQLLDSPLFRAQFGVAIPVGFNRLDLSQTMVDLSQKIKAMVVAKLGKTMVTIATDGWTNVRHRKMYNICLLQKVRGEGGFFLLSNFFLGRSVFLGQH